MGQVIAITSGKGGVGKTTTTASLGAALASRGKKVLLIDGDVGLRNLDIALGLENDAVYDLYDVQTGVVSAEDAMISHDLFPSLFLLPAPQTHEPESIETAFLKTLCKEQKKNFDFILIDSPAGLGRGFHNAAVCADMAITIITPDLASVRDGEKVLSILNQYHNICGSRIVINRYNPELVQLDCMMSIEDLLSLLNERLLGVIPEDLMLLRASNIQNGKLLLKTAASTPAYHNTASRLLGASVPLMKFTTRKKNFSLLKKLKS